MYNISGNSFASLYSKLLRRLVESPEYESSPRGLKCNEILDVGMTIQRPWLNLFKNERRDLPLKYLTGELIWYFSGKNDLKYIEKYSRFWGKIKNPDDTLNSAYGKLIFVDKNEFEWTQWSWAMNCLIQDKDSRKAIIHFNTSSHQYAQNRDFVCTMYLQFFVRDNCLHMISYMRSQDIILGMSYDVPFFSLLMKCMRKELLPFYPDLMVGTYTHRIGSLHIYEDKLQLAKEMLESKFVSSYTPKIKQNPILNKEVLNLYGGEEYDGKDKFFKWLDINSRRK